MLDGIRYTSKGYPGLSDQNGNIVEQRSDCTEILWGFAIFMLYRPLSVLLKNMLPFLESCKFEQKKKMTSPYLSISDITLLYSNK